MRFAERMEFNPYPFARLAAEVALHEVNTGRKVIHFDAGNPDVKESTKFTDALSGLIESDDYKYPGYRPIPEFLSALSGWYQERFGVKLENSEMAFLPGAKEGIVLIAEMFLDQGDEILIPDPGYPGFASPVQLFGAEAKGYTSIESIESQITEKTKVLWVNSPSNPTGEQISKKDLEKLVELAKDHNILLAYDNAYSEIYFDGEKPPSILDIPGAKDVCVELGSLSKSHSLAGYRLGWLVGNEMVIQKMLELKSVRDSGHFRAMQRLAALALREPDIEWYEGMIEEYDQRRQIIAGYLNKIGLKFDLPDAGLYIWAQIPDEYENAEIYCKEMLEQHDIVFTPGNFFGQSGERFVRVSICVNIDNIEEYFEWPNQ